MDPVLFLNGSSVNFSMDTFFTVLDIHTKSIFLMKICEELYKDSCGSCINICIQWFLFIFYGFLVVGKCYLYMDLWIHTAFLWIHLFTVKYPSSIFEELQMTSMYTYWNL
jgi:hypothetical protein